MTPELRHAVEVTARDLLMAAAVARNADEYANLTRATNLPELAAAACELDALVAAQEMVNQ